MSSRIRQQGLEGNHRYNVTPVAVTRDDMNVSFSVVKTVATSTPGMLLLAIELDLGADPGIVDHTAPWLVSVPQLSGLVFQEVGPSTVLDTGVITVPAADGNFNSRLSIRGMVI